MEDRGKGGHSQSRVSFPWRERHEMVGQTDLSSGVMYCCQLGHFGDSLKKPQGK